MTFGQCSTFAALLSAAALAACGGGGGSAKPSSGCEAQATAGETMRTVTVDGASRSYLLVVPEGYTPGRAYPLVTGWHGAGSNGPDFRGFTGGPLITASAAQGGAIFAFPSGEDVGGGTGWTLGPNDKDVKFFDAVVADVGANLCVDQNKIYAYGYSFGGGMVETLGCYRSDVLAAGVSIAGFMGDPSCESSAVPMLLWHNQDDPTVGFDRFEQELAHWSDANGCGESTSAVEPEPCQAHDCTMGDLVTCTPATGGHGFSTEVVLPAAWAFMHTH